MFKSHVTWAHTTHHDFLTSCQVSPHSATFFFFFVYSLITWVHTAHHDFFNFMSRESNNESRLFFLFFFLFKISCYMSSHSASRFFYLHVRWAHTAQHFFPFLCVNLISRESTQRITILQISRYTRSQSASQFTNDRWGWSTPTTWCQTYNLSIRKPIQWIQMTIKGMFWTYKKQERKRNFDPVIIYRKTKKNYGIW